MGPTRRRASVGKRSALAESARVMSLRDGSKKMSKSDASDQGRINLTDDADAIALKIRRAKTDAEPLPETVEGLAGRAEAANLVGMFAAMTNATSAEVLGEFAGSGFGPFKEKLAEALVGRLSPINEAAQRLRLTWSEKNGPIVHAPSRQSFGTRLIGSLGQQLKGEVALSYDPAGFVYILNVPMASLVAPT